MSPDDQNSRFICCSSWDQVETFHVWHRLVSVFATRFSSSVSFGVQWPQKHTRLNDIGEAEVYLESFGRLATCPKEVASEKLAWITVRMATLVGLRPKMKIFDFSFCLLISLCGMSTINKNREALPKACICGWRECAFPCWVTIFRKYPIFLMGKAWLVWDECRNVSSALSFIM